MSTNVCNAVTRACENGGVSIEGVLPLHFELDTVPPAADIPAVSYTHLNIGSACDDEK